MIKQKEVTFNTQEQTTIQLGSIFVNIYEFDGKKTPKATIKAKDLDRQLDFGKVFPVQIEENGNVKDVYFEVRFTEESNFTLKTYFKKGYYNLKSNKLWIDDRPDKNGKARYILRVSNVQEFKLYYEVKENQ